METLPFPRAEYGGFEKVYEPAEDTFLLLDALESELVSLRKFVTVSVECGSGSGAVITAFSKAIGPLNRLFIATDINLDACKMTKLCSHHNKQNIEVVQADLAKPLLDRLENQVDLLIFNPPYVPTEKSEMTCRSDNQLNLSWSGGEDGREVTDRFLFQYVPRLLSKPNGVAYLVAIEKNDIDYLVNSLKAKFNIKGDIIKHRKAGIESLFVIKYSWNN